MLQKLNQYRQKLQLPFQPKGADFPAYRFEWVRDLEGLQQVQRFRARQFSQQFAIQFASGLDQDLYDFNCEHAVLREKYSGEIVAYTRIRAFQGHELAQSYSATEFQLLPQLHHLGRVVEVGRTCVHPEHRSGKALSILWLHLLPKVLLQMRAQYVLGCVSIRLAGNEARAYHTHQILQTLPAHQRLNIASQQAFEPPMPSYSFIQDEKLPKLFASYLQMQAQFSQQAFYDAEFNCLDYLVLLAPNVAAKNFILQKGLLQ